jgi:tetratricopeptide (TPR) repeat protein
MAAEHSVPPALDLAFKDKYELIREIGHGGSATVILARDVKHDRSVAIKLLHQDVSKTAGERFLREIRVTAKMQHPHVLPTYDSGVVEGRLFFVMPFVDGGSLRDRLNDAKALGIPEALQIARQIRVALAHAHAAGIIHRDVKPENIMFYHGTACLADFGIARPLEELEPGITAHGTLVGTPGYMSPEQFLTGFDGRSDLYSLCCVLYEMIAGTKLFSGNTPQDLVERRSYLLARSRDAGPTLPPYIDKILDRGLARAPHHRFNDATEFVEAIDDAIAQTERPVKRISAERALETLWGRKVEIGLAIGVFALVGVALWPQIRQGVAKPRSVTLQGAPAPVSDTPFETGKAALDAWDIPRAQAELAAAVVREPENVAARLWLAESYALGRRTGREDFRVAARQLEAYQSQLDGRDSLLAEGLLALATSRYADACRAYKAQLHADTLDVLAWYGLGDCHSLDTMVVRDARSPSGWSFTGSYGVAARAYRRVVELAPGARRAVPFSLMARVLPFDVTTVRRGRSIPDGRTFLAYPGLSADTLAFVPYPLAEFQAAAPSTWSSSQGLALQRNHEVLLSFALEWVQTSPGSADAWEALALAREIRGELDGGDDGARAALNNARQLAAPGLQQVRLTSAQVRLDLKEGRFRQARQRVDSVFDTNGFAALDPESADVLSGLAALTGRVHRAGVLHVSAKSTQYASIGISPQLAAAGARFFARAAPGACDDSLRVLRREFERTLESYATPNRRAALRQLVIWQPAALAFPCMRQDAHGELAPTSPLDRAQRAFVAGNHRLVGAILDSVSMSRQGYRPGDVALDFTVQEAWLRAAIGDSVGAQRQLDLVLDALPSLRARSAVQEMAQSAAVGRAMVLRAELAAARGDRATAKRWAANVVELWAHADATLKPTLDGMRRIAR